MKLPVRIVVDTNVLVSALIKSSGPPGSILELILAGKITPLLSEPIFQEYAFVLARPRLNIAPQASQRLLTFLAAVAEWVDPQHSEQPFPNAPDAGDMPFAQIAFSARAWALVTGNSRHFTFLIDHNVRVLTPGELLRLLDEPDK